MMSTEVQRAAERLFGPDGLGAKHISLFPGASINTDAALVASGINRALDSLEVDTGAQADSTAA